MRLRKRYKLRTVKLRGQVAPWQMMAMADGGGGREINPILANCFEIKSKRNRVTLTPVEIYWEPEGCPDFRVHVPLCEVVAIKAAESRRSVCCPCIQTSDRRRKAKELVSFHVTALELSYVERAWKHRWKLRTLLFHNPNSVVVQNWIAAVQDIINGFTHRPRRLLVFINPFGGKRKAQKIYETKVRPIFDLAAIDTQVITTERANHARDFLQEACLSKLDGVIAVGGDGMFSELLNGLVMRSQKEAGINVNNYQHQPKKPELRIGIIPAGSTDAMAFSTTGINDPVTSALHMVVGDSVSLDVCGIFHENDLIRYSTSMVAYGYFGDIICDSEKNRWLGPYRYDWAGVKKILRNRAYEGEILFRLHPKPESLPTDKAKCRAGCRTCDRAQERLSCLPSEAQSQVGGWQCVRGRFLGINTCTMCCACGLTKQGVSPSAHLGDGCTDIVVVKKCSRINYLKFLLRTALHIDDPFALNFVRVYRAREFQFRPTLLEDDDNEIYNYNSQGRLKSSVWNCDGEIVEEPAINVKVYCQLIRVFARGIEADFFDAECQRDSLKKSNLLVGTNRFMCTEI